MRPLRFSCTERERSFYDRLVAETLALLTPFLYFGPPVIDGTEGPEKFFLGRDFGVSFFKFEAVRAQSWMTRVPLTQERFAPLHERLRDNLPETFGIGVVAHFRGTIYRSLYLTDCSVSHGGMILESGAAFDELEGSFEELKPIAPMPWIASRLQPPTINQHAARVRT